MLGGGKRAAFEESALGPVRARGESRDLIEKFGGFVVFAGFELQGGKMISGFGAHGGELSGVVKELIESGLAFSLLTRERET